MTYDEITIAARADVTGANDLYPEASVADLVEQTISALDLRHEAISYLVGNELDMLDYLRALDPSGQPIEVLYLPHEGRAGIAYGADADRGDITPEPHEPSPFQTSP